MILRITPQDKWVNRGKDLNPVLERSDDGETIQIEDGNWRDGSDWGSGLFLSLNKGFYLVEVPECFTVIEAGRYFVLRGDDHDSVCIKKV